MLTVCGTPPGDGRTTRQHGSSHRTAAGGRGRAGVCGTDAAHFYVRLMHARLQVTLVLDSAAAFIMERVDMVRRRCACAGFVTLSDGHGTQVLVGAEGVVESGGIINKLGTFQARLSEDNAGERTLYLTPCCFLADCHSRQGAGKSVLRCSRELQVRTAVSAHATRPARREEGRRVRPSAARISHCRKPVKGLHAAAPHHDAVHRLGRSDSIRRVRRAHSALLVTAVLRSLR